MRLAFRRLTTLVPRTGILLLGADSPEALALKSAAVSPVETFGLGEGATWRAVDVSHRDGLTHFDVHHEGRPFGRFASPLLGAHNVRNALAAVAVGARAGLTAPVLADGPARVPRASNGGSRSSASAAA